MLNKDDPVYHTMLVNRFNQGTISLQSYLEKMGENAKEEIDRFREEMDDPLIASVHGRILQLMAEWKLMPPGSVPPKLTVNMRADATPEQAANLAAMHGFNNGPIFGPTMGPQGELGIRANDDAANQGMITGQGYSTGQPIIRDQHGQPVNMAAPGTSAEPPQPGGPQGGGQGANPAPINTQGQNTPGTQAVSAPGSGATQVSPQGAANQHAQRKGR